MCITLPPACNYAVKSDTNGSFRNFFRSPLALKPLPPHTPTRQAIDVPSRHCYDKYDRGAHPHTFVLISSASVREEGNKAMTMMAI